MKDMEKKGFNCGDKVMVFGFTGVIDDVTDAPDCYGVIFDAHGNEYAVPADCISIAEA